MSTLFQRFQVLAIKVKWTDYVIHAQVASFTVLSRPPQRQHLVSRHSSCTGAATSSGSTFLRICCRETTRLVRGIHLSLPRVQRSLSGLLAVSPRRCLRPNYLPRPLPPFSPWISMRLVSSCWGWLRVPCIQRLGEFGELPSRTPPPGGETAFCLRQEETKRTRRCLVLGSAAAEDGTLWMAAPGASSDGSKDPCLGGDHVSLF